LIDTYIAPFRRRAIKRARIERGQRVLHIGCGAGETEMRVGWAALAW
jgi:cyclopropane fatty-acyl-phospholipid synthase-like methyltransferase